MMIRGIVLGGLCAAGLSLLFLGAVALIAPLPQRGDVPPRADAPVLAPAGTTDAAPGIRPQPLPPRETAQAPATEPSIGVDLPSGSQFGRPREDVEPDLPVPDAGPSQGVATLAPQPLSGAPAAPAPATDSARQPEITTVLVPVLPPEGGEDGPVLPGQVEEGAPATFAPLDAQREAVEEQPEAAVEEADAHEARAEAPSVQSEAPGGLGSAEGGSDVAADDDGEVGEVAEAPASESPPDVVVETPGGPVPGAAAEETALDGADPDEPVAPTGVPDAPEAASAATGRPAVEASPVDTALDAEAPQPAAVPPAEEPAPDVPDAEEIVVAEVAPDDLRVPGPGGDPEPAAPAPEPGAEAETARDGAAPDAPEPEVDLAEAAPRQPVSPSTVPSDPGSPAPLGEAPQGSASGPIALVPEEDVLRPPRIEPIGPVQPPPEVIVPRVLRPGEPDRIVLDSELVGPGEPDPRALVENAAPFEPTDGMPLLSVVLVDDGAGIHPTSLAALDFPVTIALEATRPDAAEIAQVYREAGHEVALMAEALPEGGTPQDMEVALAGAVRALPQAGVVLDTPDRRLGRNRAALPSLEGTGHGLLTHPGGLGTAVSNARRAGVPAAQLYRVLDEDDERAIVIGRYLDRATFEAAQEGAVIVLGRARPETVTALKEWRAGDRAATVEVAPLSAVLLSTEE